MYFKSEKFGREIRIDVAKLIAVPLGGLLFMLIADWLFTFQKVSQSELFWFGFTINVVVFMACWLKFLSVTMVFEGLYIFVDAPHKEHVYRKESMQPRQSKVFNLIIAVIAVVVALLGYTYCYNNSVLGVNHQEILRTMFTQTHFPANITVWELAWVAIRMILLGTSLTFSKNITLSYTDKKSNSDTEYGVR